MIFNFSKKPLRMSFKCHLVIWTITGTVDNCFSNSRHLVKYPNFSIFFFFLLVLLFLLLVLLLFLFGQATVKLKHNVSVNTTDGSSKYQYRHLKAPFSYALTGYGPKQLLFECHRS